MDLNQPTYAFVAQDGATYKATSADLQDWYNQGRIGLEHMVTEVGSGRQTQVREILFPGAFATPQPPLAENPVYQQAPYPRQQYGKIENHLVKAIISTVCIGCLPMGIAAIVFAAQVDGFAARGNYAAAKDAADKANRWANWSIGLGAGWFVVYIIIMIMASMNT
jgi:hypothetical protein